MFDFKAYINKKPSVLLVFVLLYGCTDNKQVHSNNVMRINLRTYPYVSEDLRRSKSNTLIPTVLNLFVNKSGEM